MEIGIFAKLACGAMLAQSCLYDPASYLLPRTQQGCVKLVAAMIAEAEAFAPGYVVPPQFQCVRVVVPHD